MLSSLAYFFVSFAICMNHDRSNRSTVRFVGYWKSGRKTLLTFPWLPATEATSTIVYEIWTKIFYHDRACREYNVQPLPTLYKEGKRSPNY